MAEQAGRATLFAKRHKPSCLRNQVRRESTDEETDSQRHTIQQPDSDVLVPETQLGEIWRLDEHIDGHVEAGYDEGPLSVADQATIDRLGIVKRCTPFKPDQTFDLLTKKPSPLCEGPMSSLPSFSFAPPRQALKETPRKEDAASPQHHDGTVPNANEAADKEHASHTRSPQTHVDTDSKQPVTQSIGAEAVLLGTIDRGRLSRVAKPRRKPRANSRPMSHGFHGPSISSNFERSIENLRLAMLADTFRMQHDHNVESKHQMETAAALREHVKLQNETIAEYKQKYQDVQAALSRLTEKAKTNQRFVMGLQKDYEELQKSTTGAQEHSKKTLLASVAELEEETEDLRREFGMTVDKLVQSQKKMKTVVEDLYAQLVVKDLENKRLVERLTDQETACAQQRKKSEDLETKLLSDIRDLQSQFKNGSTALVNRLELIQTSVDKVAADDGHDIKIKECIDTLHSLQAAPFLKVQDVRKAESMLCFFRKRIESGMEALSKAIASDGPSNADLQSSMQLRLDDVSNKLLKCEEISAENRSMHENNATLTEQLKAHQQNESHLKNHIETLKQVKIDLKARCSQFERDLSDLRDASQSLPVKTADSEQIILELHQQLATVKGDLEAVNEKSESIEQSRRSLENEKTQLSTLLEQTEARLLTAGEERVAIERTAEDRITQFRQDTESTLLSARDEIATMKRENQSLLSRLERAHADEDRIKTAETTLAADRDRLQREVNTLRVTINNRDLEIVQIHEDAAEEKRKLAEAHQTNIDDWSRRSAETSTTLKEVEAKARISEDQYHAKMTADQKVAESKLLAVEQEYRDALRKVQEQNVLSRQHSTQGSSAELVLPESDKNNRYTKPRKKVDRPNRSTIEATLEQTHGLQFPSHTLTKTSQTHIDDFDLFANAHDGRLGIEDLQNDGSNYSILETQDVGGLSMFQDFFIEELAQATPQQAGRRATSPTELSEMDSDQLARLQKEVQPVSAPKLRGCDNALIKPEDSHSTTMAVPVRSDGISADGSHSSHSQERPRSQANTASRMMPPPNSIPHQSQKHNGDRIDRVKITAHHGNHVGIGKKPGNSGTSTPDFIQSEASMSKQTYSHREPKTSARFESRDGGHSDKRKTPSGEFDRNSASKRQRKYSPTRSIISSSSIRGCSPYTYRSSAVGTRVTESLSSHINGIASTSSRTKSQASSSGIQARTASSISSPSETHCSRQKRMLQAREAPPQRRSSSRVTRSKSRNGTAFGDDFGERFSEELGGQC